MYIHLHIHYIIFKLLMCSYNIVLCKCIYILTAVAILFAVLTGVLTVTCASHNVYHVQPDDACEQQPSEICHTWQLFVSHSDLFFKSNAKFLFAEGEFFHSEGDLIVQNVTNLSLIGTGGTNNSVPPISVIKCLPQHRIHFYNVMNLLIQNLTFDKCGSTSGFLFTQKSDYQRASILFFTCIHLKLVNVFIFDPLGYAIVGYNVIGNSSLENFKVVLSEYLHTLPYVVCSLAIHWSYDGRVINNNDTNFIINDFRLIQQHTAPQICYAEKSIIEIFIIQFNPVINISNSRFFLLNYSSVVTIHIDSSSHNKINFHNCVVFDGSLTHFLDFHYFSSIPCANNSTKDHPKVAVTFVKVKFCYITYALINHSNSILQFITSSKCLQFKLDILFNDVLFEGNELVLLQAISDLPKLNNHYPISISIEGDCTVQHNEYSDSLIILTNGQIYLNGITTFTKNFAPQLVSLTHAQIKFNGITKVITTDCYTLISLTSGQILFTGVTEFSSNFNYELLLISNAQVYFNGSTRFTNNDAIEIIQSSSSLLYFSNSTLFEGNDVVQIITLYPKLSYLVLLGNANLTFSNNIVRNEMIEVVTIYNHPYPYCLFQYYVPENNKPEDFQINFLFDYIDPPNAELFREIDSINKLTSQCNWANDAAFQNSTSFAVHSKVINIRLMNNGLSYQLSKHSTVCSCQQSLEYDCNDDQLGPIYPGQNLTVDLCLPYNDEDVGILYAETRSANMPTSICKISNSDSVKHVFYRNQAKKVYFTIAANLNQPRMTECQLFLSAQPNLFTYYDTFNVTLLPCPLGFALNKGICNCDPHLSKYISDCKICYQTVRRLSNVYISGIESESSTHKYNISTMCPINYCLRGTTRINLHNPDAQCQPHRTGLLCSVCKRSYSMVFGSRQCKKCSNWHLFFITFIFFTGLLLVFILFFLNFTVTTGTINGIIFYANIMYINNSYFHIQERLITPLSVYISITNLRSCFELCFYNGMDMYAKKWL